MKGELSMTHAQPCKLAQTLYKPEKRIPKLTPGDFLKTAAMWEGVRFSRDPLYPQGSSPDDSMWLNFLKKFLFTIEPKIEMERRNGLMSDNTCRISFIQVVTEVLFTFL
jgi:hypothetical protein|nr:MAG TPA: hypothetical protein [Caudoviricetes sp.]